MSVHRGTTPPKTQKGSKLPCHVTRQLKKISPRAKRYVLFRVPFNPPPRRFPMLSLLFDRVRGSIAR